MWDDHSVAGVFAGLALFVMFFCGTPALYRGELEQWADPTLRSRSTAVASVDRLVQPVLEAEPPAPGGDMLLVWPFGNRAWFYLQYEGAGGRAAGGRIVSESGAVLPFEGRRTVQTPWQGWLGGERSRRRRSAGQPTPRAKRRCRRRSPPARPGFLLDIGFTGKRRPLVDCGFDRL